MRFLLIGVAKRNSERRNTLLGRKRHPHDAILPKRRFAKAAPYGFASKPITLGISLACVTIWIQKLLYFSLALFGDQILAIFQTLPQFWQKGSQYLGEIA